MSFVTSVTIEDFLKTSPDPDEDSSFFTIQTENIHRVSKDVLPSLGCESP